MTSKVHEALDALAAGEVDRARAAVADGGSLLAEALAEHLAAGAAGAVYDQPAAFEAFIGGGGNVALYRSVVAALARVYAEVRPRRVLDIGCGDGRVPAPALDTAQAPTTTPRTTLPPATPPPGTPPAATPPGTPPGTPPAATTPAGTPPPAVAPPAVTLVEPSAALLEAAVRRLAGHEVEAHLGRVEPFAAALPGDAVFDVAQSTFALHALPHEVRDGVLADLVAHVGVLAVVEFDVPDLPHGGPEHRRRLAETYERGLAEYGAERGLVAQGFLMPVLTGQLVPGAARVTWEQPARRWAAQVARAGFTDVEVTPLHDYWWAPAFLLTASGSAGVSPSPPRA